MTRACHDYCNHHSGPQVTLLGLDNLPPFILAFLDSHICIYAYSYQSMLWTVTYVVNWLYPCRHLTISEFNSCQRRISGNNAHYYGHQIVIQKTMSIKVAVDCIFIRNYSEGSPLLADLAGAIQGGRGGSGGLIEPPNIKNL